ncbi:veficolin-1-like [Stylophora pistillata]|uniref:veficolin-1-like n=1 Tax=Stylophora pistillata TaxID=50429 RepID=UPI000C03DB0C|nr:veficolin-1-like [Stylophora pistillata]
MTFLQRMQAQLSNVQDLVREINTEKESKTVKARNCADLFKSGERISGVYTIYPGSSHGTFDVYCDQKTAGGGWTVIQKRLDSSVGFYRDWADYKRGLGDMNSEFWLGLDKMNQFTEAGRNRIRIELEDTKTLRH